MEVVEIGVSKRFTDEEIINVYNEDYVKNHMGIPSLKKKYNYDFYDAFKKLNLEMRNNHEKNNKYSYDSDFFKDIDTEEKAYWLGFCYADGFITRGTHNTSDIKNFGISLMESDCGHLEKFRKAIKTDRPISHYIVSRGYKVGAEYCRLMVYDIRFTENIMSHGCVEHKSNILEAPTGVSDELTRHFIRGFLDANGSIAVHGKNDYAIKITSTDAVLTWIMNYLISHNILEHEYRFYKRKEGQIVSSFEFGGIYQVEAFLDHIYKDATVWLDRKYERYQEVKNVISLKMASKNQERVCVVCGKEDKSNVLCGIDGEYKGKILCKKHYSQIHRYGRILPDKKTCCDVCGNTVGRLTLVGNKYPQYYGLTLCKKHYTQLNVYGVITDTSIGKHKGE